MLLCVVKELDSIIEDSRAAFNCRSPSPKRTATTTSFRRSNARSRTRRPPLTAPCSRCSRSSCFCRSPEPFIELAGAPAQRPAHPLRRACGRSSGHADAPRGHRRRSPTSSRKSRRRCRADPARHRRRSARLSRRRPRVSARRDAAGARWPRRPTTPRSSSRSGSSSRPPRRNGSCGRTTAAASTTSCSRRATPQSVGQIVDQLRAGAGRAGAADRRARRRPARSRRAKPTCCFCASTTASAPTTRWRTRLSLLHHRRELSRCRSPPNSPVIDNRTFDDLVAEARTRIPRYTPEWTDFNAGDAGLRAGRAVRLDDRAPDLPARAGAAAQLPQVPELIGIELQPGAAGRHRARVSRCRRLRADERARSGGDAGRSAAPAETAARRSSSRPSARSPRCRRRSTPCSPSTAPTIRDVTAANADAAAASSRSGRSPPAGSALLLGFDPKLPLPGGLAELALGFWPATDRGVPPPSPCGGGARRLAPAQHRLGILGRDRLAAAEGRCSDDDRSPSRRSGFVQLRLPAAGAIVPVNAAGARRPPSALLAARAAGRDVLRTAAAAAPACGRTRSPRIAAQTVQNEVARRQRRHADQISPSPSTPVLDGTLSSQIDEGSGPQPWTEVDDFSGSGPNDTVYLLELDHGR